MISESRWGDVGATEEYYPCDHVGMTLGWFGGHFGMMSRVTLGYIRL